MPGDVGRMVDRAALSTWALLVVAAGVMGALGTYQYV
jgi:hypothetical protein